MTDTIRESLEAENAYLRRRVRELEEKVQQLTAVASTAAIDAYYSLNNAQLEDDSKPTRGSNDD